MNDARVLTGAAAISGSAARAKVECHCALPRVVTRVSARPALRADAAKKKRPVFDRAFKASATRFARSICTCCGGRGTGEAFASYKSRQNRFSLFSLRPRPSCNASHANYSGKHKNLQPGSAPSADRRRGPQREKQRRRGGPESKTQWPPRCPTSPTPPGRCERGRGVLWRGWSRGSRALAHTQTRARASRALAHPRHRRAAASLRLRRVVPPPYRARGGAAPRFRFF